MALVEPNVMVNAIMGSIYDLLTNGDETVPKSEDNYFSWITPGMPIDAKDFEFLSKGLTGVVKKPKLQTELTPEQLEAMRAQDTAGLYMQAENFARLVDCVVDASTNTNQQFARLSIMNNEGSLSECYEYILRMSQIMQTVLDDETKRKVELARSALVQTITQKDWAGTETQMTVPSPLVVAYNEKMAAYEAAALEYNCRRIAAMTGNDAQAVHYWATNASILRNRVKAAMADWQTTGKKADYESIASFIAQVSARDMALLKAGYLDDLEKARLTGLASGSDFFFTGLAPANFMTAGGWSGFSFGSSEFNRASSSKYQLSGSSAKAGGLFFGAAGGVVSHSSSNSSSLSGVKFDSATFGMSFEIAQAFILRPWFKTAFLTSKLWRFDQTNPEAKGDMVSDGGTPPHGLLTAYPTSVVCIRNLRLKMAKSSGLQQLEQALQKSSTDASMVLALGPLNIVGGGSQDSSSAEYASRAHYESETQTLTVNGTQVIGYKCHVLPKSPDPDPSIKTWI